MVVVTGFHPISTLVPAFDLCRALTGAATDRRNRSHFANVRVRAVSRETIVTTRKTYHDNGRISGPGVLPLTLAYESTQDTAQMRAVLADVLTP